MSTLARLYALAEELEVALFGILDASTVKYETFEMAIGWNDWRWGPRDDAGQPHAKAARARFAKWRALTTHAVRIGAPEREAALTREEGIIERVIEQSNDWYGIGVYEGGLDAVRKRVSAAVDAQKQLLAGLPTAHGDGERLIIADTSALLDRPDLQEWTFDGSPCTIVVFPQILGELDDRKRDPRTKDAAAKVIRQMTDFGRRGDTLVGVTLVGRVQYREVATSPDMAATLPWLRSDVPDDHIIAGALDLACEDLTAIVTVLASDRNLHNKARTAGLDYAGLDAVSGS